MYMTGGYLWPEFWGSGAIFFPCVYMEHLNIIALIHDQN